MTRLRVLLIMLIAVAFAACDQDKDENLGGREVTQQFLTEYSGSYVEKTAPEGEAEKIMIDRNGDIEVLKMRRVGKENNPALPFDTVCSYIITGQIRRVVELDKERRQRIDDKDEVYYAPQTHELIFTAHQFTLTDELEASTTSNRACQNYEDIMNQDLRNYTYGMELFGAGTIRLHTAGNDDFTDGERGALTLDEVYERE